MNLFKSISSIYFYKLFLVLTLLPCSVTGQNKFIQIATVAQRWDREYRNFDEVLHYIADAGKQGATIICLPMDCVPTQGEPIPGPTSERICDAARQYHINVIANIKEKAGNLTYQTSFLCDRFGTIIGRYRQTHKLPDEPIALGDELPIFQTEFGPIALKSGTDIFFPEVDLVYALKGAKIIFLSWTQQVWIDDYPIDMMTRGRAADFGVYEVCASYGGQRGTCPWILGWPVGNAFIADPSGENCGSTMNRPGVGMTLIPEDYFQQENKIIKNISRGDLPLLVSEDGGKVDPVSYKRKIRTAVIPGRFRFEDMLNSIDDAGKNVTDIVCLPEYPWSGYEMLAKLREIAKKAAEYRMYIVIGVGFNHEVILFGRDGQETGYYNPIKMHHALPSQKRESFLPIFETDIGKIGLISYGDFPSSPFQRILSLKGVTVICLPFPVMNSLTKQEELTMRIRSLDNSHVSLISGGLPRASEPQSAIIDPLGIITGTSDFRNPYGIVYSFNSDIQLLRFPMQPETSDLMGPRYPDEYINRPKAQGSMKETIFNQRRPLLYKKALTVILNNLQ